PIVGGGKRQPGAADGQDVGRGGGPDGRLAGVARGGDEGDAGVAGEVPVVGGGGFRRELIETPAHRHGGDARLSGGVIDRRQDVHVAVAVGLHEHDVGRRRDGVRPFHVQGDF